MVKMKYNIKNEKSEVQKLREKWFKKGFYLVNITKLCEASIGESGWCNGFNEPEETIHHIKIKYRDEEIGVICNKSYVIDDDKFLMFTTNDDDLTGENFIIFIKVRV